MVIILLSEWCCTFQNVRIVFLVKWYFLVHFLHPFILSYFNIVLNDYPLFVSMYHLISDYEVRTDCNAFGRPLQFRSHNSVWFFFHNNTVNILSAISYNTFTNSTGVMVIIVIIITRRPYTYIVRWEKYGIHTKT